MSTPLSLSSSPLTDLGSASYKTLLEDDYSVNKLNFKAKANTKNGGTVNYKASSTLEVFDGKESQEIKVQFPYNNYYFWLGARKGEIKGHIDLGEFNLVKKQNVFVNGSTDGKTSKFKVGTVYNGSKCQSHSRLAIDTKTNELTFLTRSFLRRDKFLLTFVDEFNLSRKTLTRYDFMIGYLTKDVDFFIRHYSVANPKIKCCTAFGVGRILLNFVTRRNATSFGGELEVKADQSLGLTVGYSSKVKDVAIKSKVNLMDQKVHFSAKGKFNSQFGYLIAAQVPLQQIKEGKGAQFGFTLDATI